MPAAPPTAPAEPPTGSFSPPSVAEPAPSAPPESPAPPPPFGGADAPSTPDVTPPGVDDAPPAPRQAAAASGPEINLNSVTFEQLRGQNLSVTQATRLLAHRERLGGFSSIDDLDQVAGFPDDVLADLKSRATI
jgi:hypothetical protein